MKQIHHSPEFGVGDANANCSPDFQKLPLQNSSKHAISAKKNFRGEGTYRPLFQWTPLLVSNQAFWIGVCDRQNSTQNYAYE